MTNGTKQGQRRSVTRTSSRLIKRSSPKTEVKKAEKEKAGELGQWSITSGGVYFRLEGQSLRICSQMRPLGDIVDADGRNPSIHVELETLLGETRRTEVPHELLESEKKVQKLLVKEGLDVGTGNPLIPNLLCIYLNATKPSNAPKIRAENDGWIESPSHGSGYIFGSKAYFSKQDPKEVIRSTSLPAATSGKKPDWLALTELLSGNPLAITSLCGALASALLHPLKRSPFFLMFVGPSSTGKTTLLKICAALIGRPDDLVTWEGTGNGIEAAAIKKQCQPFVIDEIGQSDGKTIGQIAYRLTNGAPRLRLGYQGTDIKRQPAKSVIISAGESSAVEKMRSAGTSIKAGQLARSITIPVREKHGVWSQLDEGLDGAEMSKKVAASVNEVHGIPWRPFIKHIVKVQSDLLPAYEKAESDWRTEIQGATKIQDDVSARVLDCFCLMAFAGSLAVDCEIVSWTKSDIVRSLQHTYSLWHELYDGDTSSSSAEIVSHVKLFFQSHRGEKFKPYREFSANHSGTLAGYEKTNRSGSQSFFLVFPAYFEHVLCGKFDKKMVIEALQAEGYLAVPKSRGGAVTLVHIPGSANLNAPFYVIRQTILVE